MDVEITWYDYGQRYIFVDGHTYRRRRELLTRIHNCRMLPLGRSRNLVASLPYQAPNVLEQLRVAFGISRPERDAAHAVARELIARLGSAGADLAAPPDAFAGFYIFEPEPLKPTPVAFPEPFNGFKPAPLSATDSWVTVACVDDGEEPKPVRDVQLEIITAAAVVHTARTDDRGVAFIDGIAPGQVTIRVLEMDGTLWRALEGEAARPSPTDDRFTWHQVKPGECLSKIAHAHGLKYWQDVWKFRLNKDLREKRKSPHRLCPGDQVAVPAPELFEMQRPTEQTHRIEIGRRRAVIAVINTHELDDPDRIDTHWAQAAQPLTAAHSLHHDDTSRALRMRHIFAQAEVALVKSGAAGGAAAEPPSSADVGESHA